MQEAALRAVLHNLYYSTCHVQSYHTQQNKLHFTTSKLYVSTNITPGQTSLEYFTHKMGIAEGMTGTFLIISGESLMTSQVHSITPLDLAQSLRQSNPIV